MLKKILLAGACLFLVGGFFFGRDVVSYVSTSAGWMKRQVKNSVPIEFEIQRARDEIKNLVPAIRQNMHVIAKEEVEIERLDQQIAAAEKRHGKEKEDLLKMTADLKSGQSAFQYASRSYSREQVKSDLANRFARFQTNDATLQSLKEIHRARETSLAKAREKMELMLSQRQQLASEVENLEARLKTLEVAKSTSDFNFDDSQLGRVKGLIADVKQRLDVDEKLMNADGYFQDEIPVSRDENVENIEEQVTSYFTPGSGNTAVAKVEKADATSLEQAH